MRAIRKTEVAAKTGLSVGTIYNLEKRGEFPPHFMLTPRCAVWDEADVDAWLDGRKKVAEKCGTPTPQKGVKS